MVSLIGVKKKSITDREIKRVETQFNVKLPNDFVECVKRNDGGSPIPNVFDIKEQEPDILNNLLTFDLDSKHSIINVCKDIQDRLIKNIIPFARDPFGNFLCFDYRESDTKPKIVFWDHEEAFKFQCLSPPGLFFA
ncbi:SMI1/KNR4 family protein [Camelliibacillus cellulosilyticus]|uniref:SMI1/KNR4 family protein n=1 Tax=Camelliibacillus cellulosilyticus TaxID=2174486 RepID=A0ABV9GQA8_9BACL